MPVVILVGPNAIGKTTAIRRWSERYRHLVAISADLGVTYIEGQATAKDKRWSADVAAKTWLINEQYKVEDKVVVIESARTDILRFAKSRGWLLCVTTDWKVHRRNMMDRCANRSKKFREDYWTEKKLVYESTGRYLNAANTHWLQPDNCKCFNAVDGYDVWLRIDRWFGILFAQLHNEIIRQRNLV